MGEAAASTYDNYTFPSPVPGHTYGYYESNGAQTGTRQAVHRQHQVLNPQTTTLQVIVLVAEQAPTATLTSPFPTISKHEHESEELIFASITPRKTRRVHAKIIARSRKTPNPILAAEG